MPSDPAKRTTTKSFSWTQDIVDNWRREAIQEGVKQGPIDVYEARFGAIPEDSRTVIDGTHDERALRAWVRLASTRDAAEVAAAIRAFRES